MNVVVALTPEATTKKVGVGDILKFGIFVDQKIGNAGDGWEIVSDTGAAWAPAGGVTASVASLRVVSSEPGVTKFEFEAMIHQPGQLTVGPFLIRNQVSKEEIEVPLTTLSGGEAMTGLKPEQEPPWLMPSMSFGAWDWLIICIIVAILFAAIAFFGRIAWLRLREHLTRHLTHTDRALHALANLQKYARSKKPLQLEEWKKFSFELAGILRKYSDENFKMDSRDMTDREFLQGLKNYPGATPWLNLIGGILATITEVRYGRKELDASLVPGLLLDARKFVESTSVEPKEKSEAK